MYCTEYPGTRLGVAIAAEYNPADIQSVYIYRELHERLNLTCVCVCVCVCVCACYKIMYAVTVLGGHEDQSPQFCQHPCFHKTNSRLDGSGGSYRPYTMLT